MLKVEKLNVYYGVIHAIKDVSFHIEDGKIISLIGANGAGKTTILHTISGLLAPKSGKVVLNEQELNRISADKIVKMGLIQVPERRRIFQEQTVEENLQLGAFTRKDKDGIQADLEKIYERFPRLKERKKQLGGTLSGGEQQMLAIARALMARPKILLLDEPSMGLAPLLVQEIFNIIKEINNDGTTVLLVEQNAKMALEISDYAYVLETGKIVLKGSGQELLNSDDIKKAYLGG